MRFGWCFSSELKFSPVSGFVLFFYINLSLVQIFCFVISHETAWDQEAALACSQCSSFTCQKTVNHKNNLIT